MVLSTGWLDSSANSPLSAANQAPEIMSSFLSETQMLLAALQTLPIAVVTTDVQGIVCSVNAALTSLAGYTAEEAVGQPVTLFLFGTSEHTFYDIVQAAILSGEPWRGEWVWRSRTAILLPSNRPLHRSRVQMAKPFVFY